MESNEQNKLMNKTKTRGMGTWNRLTDVRREGCEGDWKRLAKEHIRIQTRPTWGGGLVGGGIKEKSTEHL